MKKRNPLKNAVMIETIILLIIMPSLWIACVSAADLSSPYTRATQTKDWTFMVYMDGDNSLGAVAQKDMVKADLNEMLAAGGSDSNINIIVLMDRYGWYNSKCYFLTTSGLSEISLSSVGFQSRELNMGNPETLSTFVIWAMKNYPAEKYFLDMWDHGSGWSMCCCDDTNADELTPTDLESALQQIKAKYGRLDAIGFDACYMASQEMMYQLKNYADIYGPSSETREAFEGWDYESSISWLKSNPTATPTQLVTRIIDDYDNYYSTQYTLSAINLTRFDVQLSDNLNLLLQALKHRSNTYNSEIYQVSAGTLFYRSRLGSNTICDLYDFVDNVDTQIPGNATIQALCTALKTQINNAVIYEKHSGDLTDSHGISFYFPNSPTYFDYRFFNLKWHTDSAHYQFLKHYWHMENEITAPTTKPTIETFSTTCYVNGTGAQAKIDRGDWRTGSIPISTGQHTLYARRYDNGEYSEVNSTTISGISLVITPRSATSYSIALTEGWNLISAPTISTNARDWCIELGAREVIRKNTLSGAYDEYVYDYSSDDKNYAIDSTKGYFVYHENGTTYTYQALTIRPVSLVANWNLIGVASDSSASSILALSDSIKSVVRRNTDGSYSTYVSAVPSGDFTITKGSGAFVYTSNPQAIRI